MIKTVMLVPVRDNGGRGFSPVLWREFERKLIEAFGGFTRTPDVVGVWEHQGRVYRDRSHRYEVALTGWTLLPRWLEVVDWVRRVYRQAAIYVEVAGVPEIISE